MRFGVNQLDRAASRGISAASAPVMVLDSSVEIRGYSRIECIVPAAHNVNVPGGCEGVIHRDYFSAGEVSREGPPT